MKTRFHLLVADDDPDELIFITKALQQHSAQVGTLETVSDGDKVIQKLQRLLDPAPADGNRLPDLVVLDLKLPRKNGLEVLEWLREKDIRLPIIIHTSSDDPREAARALELGAEAFVVKEVRYRSLVEKVDEILQRRD